MDKTLRWYKSSRSNGSGACVEVAHRTTDAGTYVRDTKDRRGGHLEVSARGWTSFLDAVKAGRLH